MPHPRSPGRTFAGNAFKINVTPINRDYLFETYNEAYPEGCEDKPTMTEYFETSFNGALEGTIPDLSSRRRKEAEAQIKEDEAAERDAQEKSAQREARKTSLEEYLATLDD